MLNLHGQVCKCGPHLQSMGLFPQYYYRNDDWCGHMWSPLHSVRLDMINRFTHASLLWIIDETMMRYINLHHVHICSHLAHFFLNYVFNWNGHYSSQQRISQAFSHLAVCFNGTWKDNFSLFCNPALCCRKLYLWITCHFLCSYREAKIGLYCFDCIICPAHVLDNMGKLQLAIPTLWKI